MAGPFYERAVKLNPGNINARMKLADTYKAIYKNRGALEQLNYLYDSSRINFSQRLMLAEFLVHEGKIEKAGKLLTDGEKIYPYAVPATYDLLGRASLLSNKTTQAISYYQTYLKYNPSDAHVYYTIARLYQRSGNKKQAMQWLKEALNIGFNYSWVLMNDEVWTSSRNTTEWKKILAAVSMKQYQTPLH
jgi:tetratricopeptide (TPR) repeat protein